MKHWIEKDLEENITGIKNKFIPSAWYGFFSVWVFGLLTHGYLMMNRFFNHDSVGLTLPEAVGKGVDRWFQTICWNLVSYWKSSTIDGFLTIALIAISTLLLIDTLEIRNKYFGIIVGAIMITTPTVAVFLSFTGSGYLFVIGLPFSILAARWYDKKLIGLIASFFCVVLAIAGYQSLVAVTISCMYIKFFMRLLEKDFDTKKYLLDILRALAVIFWGLVLYLLSTKVFSFLFYGNNDYAINMGVTAENVIEKGYAARPNAGVLYFAEIPRSIIVSIKYFIKYHFNAFFGGANQSPINNLCVWANVVVLTGILVIVCTNIFKKKSIVQKILIISLFALAPLCLNSIEVILNGKCDESRRMMYCIVITIALIFAIYEKDYETRIKWKNIIINISMICLCFHVYYNMQITTDAYMRMTSFYRTAYSEMTRIVDRIEQIDMDTKEKKVYFAYKNEGGYLTNDNFHACLVGDSQIDMGWLSVEGTMVDEFYHSGTVMKFCQLNLGVNYAEPTEKEIEKIHESKEFMEMEKFPAKESVKVIDGIIVVLMDDSE